MQSIWYKLTHIPRNIDDFLDVAGQTPGKTAKINLIYYDIIKKRHPVIQLLAEIEIKYGGSVKKIKEICGQYRQTNSEEEKRSKVRHANTKLKKIFEKMSAYDVPFEAADNEFEINPPDHRKTSENANPYEQFANAELILRDQLAIDRTILANERTFLAYIRTALSLILTGVGFIKFFESFSSHIAGWILIGLGIIVSFMGTWRTIRIAHSIKTAQSE